MSYPGSVVGLTNASAPPPPARSPPPPALAITQINANNSGAINGLLGRRRSLVSTSAAALEAAAEVEAPLAGAFGRLRASAAPAAAAEPPHVPEQQIRQADFVAALREALRGAGASAEGAAGEERASASRERETPAARRRLVRQPCPLPPPLSRNPTVNIRAVFHLLRPRAGVTGPGGF